MEKTSLEILREGTKQDFVRLEKIFSESGWMAVSIFPIEHISDNNCAALVATFQHTIINLDEKKISVHLKIR